MSVINVEVSTNQDGITELHFKSRRASEESKDILDQILFATVAPGLRRGGYINSNSVKIQFKPDNSTKTK